MIAENADISPVLSRIAKHLGIDFSLYREGTLRRRIMRRVSACACTDVAAYLSILDSNPIEFNLLLRDITIKYTEFFRDRWVYDVIRDHLLPSIAARKRPGEGIAIWSAGCATGEEAYSLAVTVRRAADSGLDLPPVEIIGTDIDPKAIETARRGSYVADLLPTLPDEEESAYFHREGRYIRVSPQIREMVRFHVHDLISPSARDDMSLISARLFDLILCRNVLIYLKRAGQTALLTTLHEMLVPEGFLVLGTGEIVTEQVQTPFTVIDPGTKVYRKDLAAETT